jgi:4-amino-4-deoxy-L-arabinose transferase-like glycosyltransferase
MACCRRGKQSLTGSTSPGSARNHEYAYTLAVALVALLPRLYVAIAWSKEPVWDGHYYHLGAERLAQGLGYSEDVIAAGQTLWKPWIHYPVGYSLFLAPFYFLFGPKLLIAPILNALIGAVTAAAAHRFGRYYLPPGRAALAGGLVALHPGLIAYSPLVMTELLAALLLLAAGLAMLRFREGYRGIVLAGLALGVATLVRPASLLVLPLLALMSDRPFGRAALRALIAAGIALAVVLPWTLRNCARFDGCALVSTNGGWNLAIGALTKTGRFHGLTAADGCAVVTGQVQQDACWREVGLRVIKKNPAVWLEKIPGKLQETFSHESFAIEYLHEADPSVWPEERRAAGRKLLTFFHRLLLIAAALGAVSSARWLKPPPWNDAVQLGLLLGIALFGAYAFADASHPFFLLPALLPLLAALPLPGRPELGASGRYLVGVLAVTTLTHAVFFGEDRYHVVVIPVLCLLAAGALRHSPSPLSRT